MKTRLLAVVILCLASAAPLLGQTKPDGTWTGTIAGPQGDQTVTMTLKAAGDTLSGTISDFQGGEQPIEDGTIKGDTISFYQTLSFNGSPLEIFYIALVHAEELLFELEVQGMPEPLQFTVKRVP
jgi:hypothetical protein